MQNFRLQKSLFFQPYIGSAAKSRPNERILKMRGREEKKGRGKEEKKRRKGGTNRESNGTIIKKNKKSVRIFFLCAVVIFGPI